MVLPRLRPYQSELVLDAGDTVGCVAATQVGKTLAYAVKVVAYAMQNAPDLPIWWCAPTYKQAVTGQRALWKVCTRAGLTIAGPQPPFRTVPAPPHVLICGTAIEFRTWDKPANLMGDPISLAVLDEAGLLDDDAHGAILTRRSATMGPVWYIGNPGQTAGPFRKVCARLEEQGRLHTWTWRDLHAHYVESGQLDRAAKYKALIEKDRDSLPGYEFRRLYEAEWTSDEAAVFREVRTRPADAKPGDGHRRVIGVDVAQVQDYLVAAGMRTNEPVIDWFWRTRGTPYPAAAQELKRVSLELDAPLIVEYNGPGIALIEQLRQIGAPVVSFTTTSQSKQEIILALASVNQEGRLEIPESPPWPYEFSVFRYERTPAGAYRYSAPSGDHDDTVMAAALANWGRARAPGKLEFL